MVCSVVCSFVTDEDSVGWWKKYPLVLIGSSFPKEKERNISFIRSPFFLQNSPFNFVSDVKLLRDFLLDQKFNNKLIIPAPKIYKINRYNYINKKFIKHPNNITIMNYVSL